MSQNRFTVRVNDSLAKRLEIYSDREGISKNQVMNDALTYYLNVMEGRGPLEDIGEIQFNRLLDAILGLGQQQQLTREEIRQLSETFNRFTTGENYFS